MSEKLPQEFKDKWVAALRSGEYKQGTGVLYNPDTDCYCCLGVAAVLCQVPKDKIVGASIIRHELHFSIPQQIRGAAGEGCFVGDLTEMNDLEHKSFPEIADYIEQNL